MIVPTYTLRWICIQMLISIPTITGLTIDGAKTEESITSTTSETPDFRFLYSVSAHPPFVIPNEAALPREIETFENRSTIIEIESPTLSADEILEDPMKFSDFSPILKRGTPPEEEQVFQSSIPVNVMLEAFPLNYDFEWQRLQVTAQGLHDKLRMLKTQISKSPARVKIEYVHLREGANSLYAELSQLRARAANTPTDLLNTIAEIWTLCEMFELDKTMREQGCQEYLDSVLVQDATGKIFVSTKLALYTDNLQEFAATMLQCYKKDGTPDLTSTDLFSKIGGVQIALSALKKVCREFLSSGTPLARIFAEDLVAVEKKLFDLNVSALSGTVQASMPSEKWKKAHSGFEKSDQIFEQNFDDFLEQSQLKLVSALEENPQKYDALDLDRFLNWRVALHRSCDEIYLQMIQMSIPESAEKTTLQELLQEATNELSRKANSAILVATVITCDGKLEDDKSMLVFTKLYQILKADIAYVESKLDTILENLEMIQAENNDEESNKDEVRVHELLVERTSLYMNVSEWVHLPEASSLKQKHNAALVILGSLKKAWNGEGEVSGVEVGKR